MANPHTLAVKQYRPTICPHNAVNQPLPDTTGQPVLCRQCGAQLEPESGRGIAGAGTEASPYTGILGPQAVIAGYPGESAP